MSNKLYYRDKKMWTSLRNLAIVLILMGLMVMTLYYTTLQPLYEDMLHGTITIQSLEYIPGSRGTGHYVLTSTQENFYRISPQDAVRALDQKVEPGTRVEITYYTTTFPSHHHISEMFAGETELVTYHNYRVSNFIICAFFFLMTELLGAGLLWLGILFKKKGNYTKEKTLELKERARLQKQEN